MKLFNKLILFFTIALAAQLNLNSMEAPKTSQNLNQKLSSNIRQNFANHLDKLPDEVKLVILQHLSQAITAESMKEVFKNLATISQVNKDFYNLVHDESFIRSITQEYLNKKSKEEIDKEFFEAAKLSYTPIVKAMLLAGIDPNIQDSYGNTALIYASMDGRTNIIEILLANENTNPNIQNKKFGNTALIYATSLGLTDAVKALLNNEKTDPNIKNKFGSSALIYAVIMNQPEMVKALLNSEKTDPNVKNTSGDPALIKAIMSKNIEMVKAFLANPKTDVFIKNKQGQTALDIAKNLGNQEIAELISQYILSNMPPPLVRDED